MPSKNKSKVILVTGATGHQGGAALRHLHDRGFSCRALTRDTARPAAHRLMGNGVEVARGDMEDPASLTRALDGVHGVFAVQTPFEAGIEAEVRQGINLVDAAKRSRITQFVYSSVASADRRTGIPHFDSKFRVEEHLRGAGMRYTIVRPTFFMENWMSVRESIQSGELALPLDPETRLQMVAVTDIGATVAAAFEHPGKWQDRVFEIAGDELTMSDVTRALSRVAGRDVRYRKVPWDKFEARSGADLTAMYRWLQDTGYTVDISAVRQEYPALMTFDRWLNANWHTAIRTA